MILVIIALKGAKNTYMDHKVIADEPDQLELARATVKDFYERDADSIRVFSVGVGGNEPMAIPVHHPIEDFDLPVIPLAVKNATTARQVVKLLVEGHQQMDA